MKKGEFCPLIQKKCVEEKCSWYTCVRGVNPNTGQEIDEWRCAVAWMPMMAVEIAQKSNQTGAAVESFRNEVVEENYKNRQLYAAGLDTGVIGGQLPHTPLIEG